jgi:hypothetical protein
MEVARTESHDKENNAMARLLLLYSAQTRKTKSRVVKGTVIGYIEKTWRT